MRPCLPCHLQRHTSLAPTASIEEGLLRTKCRVVIVLSKKSIGLEGLLKILLVEAFLCSLFALFILTIPRTFVLIETYLFLCHIYLRTYISFSLSLLLYISVPRHFNPICLFLVWLNNMLVTEWLRNKLTFLWFGMYIQYTANERPVPVRI